MVNRFMLACVVLFELQGVLAAGTEGDISDVLNEFRQRIELLEVRDAAKDARITELESEIWELKSKMVDLESTHRQKEATLQNRINMLEKTMDQSSEKQPSYRIRTGPDSVLSIQTRIAKRKSTFRKDRAVPETEVAFYATHTDHDVHNLGNNQIVLFQQTITNNGNAYNNITGAFVAPVGGTYVFHATIMGLDLDANQQHYRAHFDVDGTPYSVFFVTHFDQSSQMFIINLHAGQVVTIRNDYANTGFVGTHHSSFSGFLLYQDYPSGAVVGK